MDPGTTGNCFSPGLPLLTHFHFISSPPALSYVRSILYLLEFPANLVITGSLPKNTVITMLNQTRLLAQITLALPHSASLCAEDKSSAQFSGAKMGASPSAAHHRRGMARPRVHQERRQVSGSTLGSVYLSPGKWARQKRWETCPCYGAPFITFGRKIDSLEHLHYRSYLVKSEEFDER